MGRRSRMLSRALPCVATTLLVALGGCERSLTEASPPVAKVAGQVLTVSDLDLMLRNSITEQATPEAQWSAVERWTSRELLYQEALRRGIDRQPDVALQVKTATRELVINAMLDQIFREELAVTDEEIQKYYDEHRTLFRRTETTIRVRQIVLDGAREARRAYDEVSRHLETFEEVARTRSNDPSSTEGGDLGYISAATAYNLEIWQALQRMSENDISRPINTDAGWHILKVEERRSAGSIKTLDEVRPEIINRVRATKRLALITELVERLKLQEPYVVYEDQLGPRRIPSPSVPSAMDSLEDHQ